MIPNDTHLQIGSLLFEGVDQIDLTGPSKFCREFPIRLHYRIYGKTGEPVRDLKGLRLTPDAPMADAPQLDVLHVPGGFGQETLMEDVEVLAWDSDSKHPARASSRCARVRCFGAAGLAQGEAGDYPLGFIFTCCRSSSPFPSTNGWSSTGSWIFAAGASTAGIDGRFAPRGDLAWRRSGTGHSALHGLRPRSRLRQRHAGNRARCDTRAWFGSRPQPSRRRREATA